MSGFRLQAARPIYGDSNLNRVVSPKASPAAYTALLSMAAGRRLAHGQGSVPRGPALRPGEPLAAPSDLTPRLRRTASRRRGSAPAPRVRIVPVISPRLSGQDTHVDDVTPVPNSGVQGWNPCDSGAVANDQASER